MKELEKEEQKIVNIKLDLIKDIEYKAFSKFNSNILKGCTTNLIKKKE